MHKPVHIHIYVKGTYVYVCMFMQLCKTSICICVGVSVYVCVEREGEGERESSTYINTPSHVRGIGAAIRIDSDLFERQQSRNCDSMHGSGIGGPHHQTRLAVSLD